MLRGNPQQTFEHVIEHERQIHDQQQNTQSYILNE
jgi:hypothetical protein